MTKKGFLVNNLRAA